MEVALHPLVLRPQVRSHLPVRRGRPHPRSVPRERLSWARGARSGDVAGRCAEKWATVRLRPASGRSSTRAIRRKMSGVRNS